MKRSSDASIPSFLCGAAGLLHIWIPNFLRWFGFISYFSILFLNHKPFSNSSISNSPKSSVKAVTRVNIGKFIYYTYSGSNGGIVTSSKVNAIVQKFAPKQWVSAGFSISVVNALQITLSWFLCTLLIIRWLPVLMLDTTLFKIYLGMRSTSKVFVMRFFRWSYMTTLRSSVSFLFEEVLPLFVADTCYLLPLVSKQFTPPSNPDSFRISFWTPLMIWEINRFSLSFSTLIGLVVRLFLFSRNFVLTWFSVILLLL